MCEIRLTNKNFWQEKDSFCSEKSKESFTDRFVLYILNFCDTSSMKVAGYSACDYTQQTGCHTACEFILTKPHY